MRALSGFEWDVGAYVWGEIEERGYRWGFDSQSEPSELTLQVPEMAKPLTQEAIEAFLATLPNWSLDASAPQLALRRTYKLPSYRACVGFVMEVALMAERADHHPDILLGYGLVEVRTTSHDAKGISERDLALAAECDAIFAARGGAG